ncbi:hypothetical protein BC628DRAFT_897530 [Trametes gibbosa]|nr:hypothetical protein BC628DRAFT_897530 [Trametes gibbosa]
MLAASAPVPSSAASVPTHQTTDTDPFVLYARSLHDYTLGLWTESRRVAEEKARNKAATAPSSTRDKPDPPQGQANGWIFRRWKKLSVYRYCPSTYDSLTTLVIRSTRPSREPSTPCIPLGFWWCCHEGKGPGEDNVRIYGTTCPLYTISHTRPHRARQVQTHA